MYDAKPFTAIELTAVLSPSAIAIAHHYYNLMREKIPNGFYNALLPENRARTAVEIRKAAIDNLRHYIGEQTVFDDITLVVLKQK